METQEQDLVTAFGKMWGHYPAPVMLLNKQHVILGANRMAQAAGITTGINCYTLAGRDKICVHCKAARARKSGNGIREVAYSETLDKVMDGFWIPVDGHEDYYVHFGNDISEYADPETFPQVKPAAE